VRIAKTGKPQSIGKNLLLAAIEDAMTMFSNKLLKDIDLSNDTVSRRINYMAGNAESQLIERDKNTRRRGY
jgi:hypothetical protein